MMTKDELTTKVAEAWRKFESLSPEEQKRHRDEQRRSFVRGNLLLSNPDMTVEEANALIERSERNR